MILEAAPQLGDHEVVPHLLDVVEAAFADLADAWPSATDVAVARYVLGYVNPIGSGVNSVRGGYAAEAYDVRADHLIRSGICRQPATAARTAGRRGGRGGRDRPRRDRGRAGAAQGGLSRRSAIWP